jgi:hypothetical protein
MNMKIMTSALLILFLALPSLLSATEDRETGNSTLEVSGIGYPPIKAQNVAQARLMARRAAVLDAYRNALAGSGTANGDEKTYYSGLSGFVKGLVIDKEEYLEDGGVRIRGTVPAGNIAVSSGTTGKGTTEKGGTPSQIPLDEWYKIIDRSVRFD